MWGKPVSRMTRCGRSVSAIRIPVAPSGAETMLESGHLISKGRPDHLYQVRIVATHQDFRGYLLE